MFRSRVTALQRIAKNRLRHVSGKTGSDRDAVTVDFCWFILGALRTELWLQLAKGLLRYRAFKILIKTPKKKSFYKFGLAGPNYTKFLPDVVLDQINSHD